VEPYRVSARAGRSPSARPVALLAIVLGWRDRGLVAGYFRRLSNGPIMRLMRRRR